MTRPIARDSIYRKRAFDADIIELCVRWYITYRLSYRDLVEMMAERRGKRNGRWHSHKSRGSKHKKASARRQYPVMHQNR